MQGVFLPQGVHDWFGEDPNLCFYLDHTFKIHLRLQEQINPTGHYWRGLTKDESRYCMVAIAVEFFSTINRIV